MTRPTRPVISLMACPTTRTCTTHPTLDARLPVGHLRDRRACATGLMALRECVHTTSYRSQPWLATSAAVRHLVTNR